MYFLAAQQNHYSKPARNGQCLSGIRNGRQPVDSRSIGCPAPCYPLTAATPGQSPGHTAPPLLRSAELCAALMPEQGVWSHVLAKDIRNVLISCKKLRIDSRFPARKYDSDDHKAVPSGVYPSELCATAGLIDGDIGSNGHLWFTLPRVEGLPIDRMMWRAPPVIAAAYPFTAASPQCHGPRYAASGTASGPKVAPGCTARGRRFVAAPLAAPHSSWMPPLVRLSGSSSRLSSFLPSPVVSSATSMIGRCSL